MRGARLLLAALLLLPGRAIAQSPAFTHLLNGEIAFRAPLPWRVARTVGADGVDGVILEYQETRDTAMAVAIVAYKTPLAMSFTRWTDSALADAHPSDSAERLTDDLSPTHRSVLWKDGHELTMDRFIRTSHAVLWVRMLMPSSPPAPHTIQLRLRALDDLLTTIQGDARLLFPEGSRFAVMVYGTYPPPR